MATTTYRHSYLGATWGSSINTLLEALASDARIKSAEYESNYRSAETVFTFQLYNVKSNVNSYLIIRVPDYEFSEINMRDIMYMLANRIYRAYEGDSDATI